PSTAGSVTISTSSEYVFASGVTISSFRVLAIIQSRILFRRQVPARKPELYDLLAFFNFVDAALHVEVVLRHIVIFAGEDFLEAAHRLGHGNLLAFAPGEHLRHRKRLAEEALNFAGAEHRQLVFRR